MTAFHRSTLLFTALLTLTASSQAWAGKPTQITHDHAQISIIRNGETTKIQNGDKAEMIDRIVKLFNNYIADTSKPWLRQKLERDGVSLNDKWASYKNQSYFELSYPSAQEGVEDLIVMFNETNDKGPYGLVIAKHKDGKVMGYEVDTSELTSLYCYDSIVKYLPPLYRDMAIRYSADEFKDSGVSCNKETDDYLHQKLKDKCEKRAKWEQKKGPYGIILPVEKDDTEGLDNDGTQEEEYVKPDECDIFKTDTP